MAVSVQHRVRGLNLRLSHTVSTSQGSGSSEKNFRFDHYLSVLSAVKILQPHKFIFHYEELPVYDQFWYHTWFIEMKQSVASLHMQKSENPLPCEGNASLSLAVTLLTASEEGGVYIQEDTLLTHMPLVWKTLQISAVWSLPNQPDKQEVGLLMTKPGRTADQIKTEIEQSKTKMCRTVSEFNTAGDQPAEDPPPCVTLTSPVFPRDVINSSDPFSILARHIYYGRESRLVAETDDQQVIPRIGHMIYFFNAEKSDWPFYAYLSTLSALHIAGISRLFVYGDKLPSGQWWDRLQGENVTFVKIERIETVFQQPVQDLHHKTDILRYFLLWKYGGVYQDYDIIWANPIPEENWLYPAVTGVDWPKMGEWPEYFNLGVLMGKAGSSYMRHVLNTFRYYLDNSWGFNALQLPYRAFEQHPDTVHIDYRMQVICFYGVCHPAWHEDYQRPLTHRHRPTQPFELSEFSAFHFTFPNTPPTMDSLAAIKSGKDMFAQLGRKILEKSGRGHELEDA